MLELCNLDFQIKLSPALCTAQYKNTTVLRKGHAYFTSISTLRKSIILLNSVCIIQLWKGGNKRKKDQ